MDFGRAEPSLRCSADAGGAGSARSTAAKIPAVVSSARQAQSRVRPLPVANPYPGAATSCRLANPIGTPRRMHRVSLPSLESDSGGASFGSPPTDAGIMYELVRLSRGHAAECRASSTKIRACGESATRGLRPSPAAAPTARGSSYHAEGGREARQPKPPAIPIDHQMVLRARQQFI